MARLRRRTKWFTIDIVEELDGRFSATALCAIKGINPPATRTVAKSPRGALRKMHAQMKKVWGTGK